jgi:phospholipid transport system substrate-binding protein
MSSRMRTICKAIRLVSAGLLLACALAVAATGARADDQTPSQVVDGLANRVVPILRNKSLSGDQKREQIEQIAYEAMDFDTLSKLVLARNWSKFSPAQQSEFVDLFKKHLSITYGRNVDNYKNERVQILSERKEGYGDVTVLTKILRGGGDADVLVDYRLRQRDGRWKIIDVIVEGVSLVSNFRSQFQEIVANGGPDHLIALLKEKNAKGESLQPDSPGAAPQPHASRSLQAWLGVA